MDISFNIIVTFNQYFSFSILVMWLHWQSSERILDYIWLHSKYESRKKIKHPIMLYAIPVDFGNFFRFFVFVLTNFSIKNKEFVTEYAFSKIFVNTFPHQSYNTPK